MRRLLLISSVCLAACASVGEEDVIATDKPDMITSTPEALAPQTLAAGECGLFGWDAAGMNAFVFFAEQDAALYADGQSIRTLQPQTDFPSTDYGPVQLDLGPAEDLIDGTRYAQARLSEVLDDGFTRVQPLVILESCGER